SQLWGVLALRLANADLLPFDFASYAGNIRQFVNELAKKNNLAAQEIGKGTASAVPLAPAKDLGFSPWGTLSLASMISYDESRTESARDANEESNLDLNPI